MHMRSDRHPDAAVQYVYEENSYAPLARVDSTGDAAEVYWYHADLNGLPERMTDADGERCGAARSAPGAVRCAKAPAAGGAGAILRWIRWGWRGD
ncbi:hypothetical protein LG71_05775 [Pluralibacter gergoviae]|nr:RHS domain-containing protein [Pluralibacter gergoviae]AIQ99445.1 hypothetical protein LG71_05775 [Pluralibacter gergoviae]OHY62643.1 hypothetical protein BB778_23290 [Pluralibacter gergoviae]